MSAISLKLDCAGRISPIGYGLNQMSIILALTSNMVFAFASTLFTDFSREVSGKWINCFKLCAALIGFVITALIFRQPVAQQNIAIYIVSGAIGLFLADHFLCQAFSKLGSARTLLIFSFAPLFVATWCYLFFGEKLDTHKFVAIGFFMACVFTISFEKLKEQGRWEIAGLILAFSGVILDGLANVVTTFGFRQSPTDSVFTVCALRATGAFIAFLLLSPFLKVGLIENFLKLEKRKRYIALLASFLGAYLSLNLWIGAVKIGNLTTLVALSGLTPLLAGVFEILRAKTKATRYLFIAFIFYACGFYFLILHN